MPQWVESATGVFIGSALAILLVVKYKGNRWLTKWRSHV
jgi:hypothetical protein